MSRRSDRRNALIPAALAALFSLGAGAGASASPVQLLAESQGQAFSVSKEYVDPRRAQKQKKKKIQISGGKGKGQRWQWDRRGNARDGVGNYRSAKRLRRQILTSMVGVPNTGRQWRKLRRVCRQRGPGLLTSHPLQLLKFATTGREP